MGVGELFLVLGVGVTTLLFFLHVRRTEPRRDLPIERLSRPQGVPDPHRPRPHWLVATGGDLDGKTWWLGERTATIGRTPDNMIQVNEKGVSRTHARLEHSGAGPVLVDLESSNGTHVNGRTVQRTTLVEGDMILIGNQAFRYEAVANHLQDAAMGWREAGGGVHLDTMIGSSADLKSAIQLELDKKNGNVSEVAKSLGITQELVIRIMENPDDSLGEFQPTSASAVEE